MSLEWINKTPDSAKVEKNEFSKEYLNQLNQASLDKNQDIKNREEEYFKKDENILADLDSQLNLIPDNNSEKNKNNLKDNNNLNFASTEYINWVRTSFNNKNTNVLKRIGDFFSKIIW